MLIHFNDNVVTPEVRFLALINHLFRGSGFWFCGGRALLQFPEVQVQATILAAGQ